jgi:hypothetical protein
MRLGFPFLISLTLKIIQLGKHIIPTILLKCHCIQLKLVFASQHPEGAIIATIFFNTQRYQRLLLGPFINNLDDVELTNGYFQQDSATAHPI